VAVAPKPIVKGPVKVPVKTTKPVITPKPPTTKPVGGTTSTVTPPPPPPPKPPAPPVAGGPTTGTDVGYADLIKQTLASWGLSSLAGLVDQLGRTGASQDQITLQIQQSPEYKVRFAGNDARIANGLAALDPATYIALEGQYRQILSGLPSGFYDSKSAFDGFIGNDISPSELSDRVAVANQAYITAPSSVRQAWDTYYGNSSGVGGAIAAILDTKTAAPLIEQRALAAEIGGAALQQGLALTGSGTATAAAQNGVTIDQARQAYQGIAARLNTDTSIAGRFGTTFGQTQEEQAQLLGSGEAQTEQSNLYAEESAQFTGRGGADTTSGNVGGNF
jgi:hypothetical protein